MGYKDRLDPLICPAGVQWYSQEREDERLPELQQGLQTVRVPAAASHQLQRTRDDGAAGVGLHRVQQGLQGPVGQPAGR